MWGKSGYHKIKQTFELFIAMKCHTPSSASSEDSQSIATRDQLVDVAEKQADVSPSLNAILNVFLAPPLHLYARDNEDAKHIISLLSRLHTALRTDELKKLFSMNFAKFFSALYQHCSTPYPIWNSTRLRDVYFSLSVSWLI